METITFRCSACQKVLKIGADKAGRSAKCSKCGTALRIPSKSEAEPPPPAPPPKKVADDEDDGSAGYGIREGPTVEEERTQREVAASGPALKGPGRKATKKQAKITNAVEWRRVGLGARVIAAGLFLWLFANLLYYVALIMGLVAGEEYAAAADERLGAGNFDLVSYAVAIVAGNSGLGMKMWLFRLSQVVHLLQWAVLLVGYFICLAAPNRFGIRLQLLVLFLLAFVNSLCLLGFKLLPMFDVHRFVILPFAVPEIAMVEMNGERVETIFTFWLKWPVLEAYGAVLMTLLLYLEPAIIATFLLAVGKSIKSDDLQAKGNSLMLIAFSQLFIQIIWLMAGICGSSVVLLWLLRIIYLLGTAFFVYQLIFTALALLSVPAVVEEQLGDEADSAGKEKPEEDEDDEEDEDEEDEE